MRTRRLAPLIRASLLMSLGTGLMLTTPALADVASTTTTESDDDDDDDDDDDEDEEDDDKGCATVVAPVSVISLALGVGLVALQRRREED